VKGILKAIDTAHRVAKAAGKVMTAIIPIGEGRHIHMQVGARTSEPEVRVSRRQRRKEAREARRGSRTGGKGGSGN
jgi:hypothetical protein